jgi:hypothetical protein
VDGLTGHCNEKLRLQYLQRHCYAVLALSDEEGAFWVRRVMHTSPPTTNPLDPDKYWKYVVSGYMRTRKVALVQSPGKSYWSYSCLLFQKARYCCRHIYSVVDRPPTKTDAAIRWWTSYLLHYKRNDGGLYRRLRQTANEQGARQVTSFVYNELEGRHSRSSSFFEEAWTRSILRTSGTYWEGKDVDTIAGEGELDDAMAPFDTSQEFGGS